MKPISTLDLIFAVLHLIKMAVELVNKKEVKNVKTNRNDHDNVINEFLDRK